MRHLFSFRYLIIVVILSIYLIGCAGVDKIPPLNLPSSETIDELKSYNRYTFKGGQRTKQAVEKGDMVLVVASGAGEAKKIKGRGFTITIGKNPAFNPLNASYRGGIHYGYFMASSSGNIKLSYKYVSHAGIYETKALYCKADIFVFPESSERNIFEILEKFVSKNPEDYTFHSQVEQFIYDYHWLIYTKLEIESSPSFADVYIDGEFIGKTPIELDKINKHSAHNICVKLNEYSEHCESFSPKGKSRFNIGLKKLPSDEHEKIATYTYIEDKDPPLIEIKEPQIIGKDNIINISEYKTRISGNARDKNGIVWVKINGANANLDTNGDFWLITPLAVGLNNIQAISK